MKSLRKMRFNVSRRLRNDNSNSFFAKTNPHGHPDHDRNRRLKLFWKNIVRTLSVSCCRQASSNQRLDIPPSCSFIEYVFFLLSFRVVSRSRLFLPKCNSSMMPNLVISEGLQTAQFFQKTFGDKPALYQLSLLTKVCARLLFLALFHRWKISPELGLALKLHQKRSTDT